MDIKFEVKLAASIQYKKLSEQFTSENKEYDSEELMQIFNEGTLLLEQYSINGVNMCEKRRIKKQILIGLDNILFYCQGR